MRYVVLSMLNPEVPRPEEFSRLHDEQHIYMDKLASEGKLFMDEQHTIDKRGNVRIFEAESEKELVQILKGSPLYGLMERTGLVERTIYSLSPVTLDFTI